MDVADAHIKVLENLFKNESSFLKFNIGTGKGTSVMELLKIFEKVNKVKFLMYFQKGDLEIHVQLSLMFLL